MRMPLAGLKQQTSSHRHQKSKQTPAELLKQPHRKKSDRCEDAQASVLQDKRSPTPEEKRASGPGCTAPC